MNKLRKLTASSGVPLLCIIAMAIVMCTGCGGSHVHQKEALEFADLIKALLVSEKLCQDADDCTRKEYYFHRPSEVLQIYIYGITDRTTVKKIVDLCIEFNTRNPNIKFELTMYAQKRPRINIERNKTTILKLILNKEELQ